MDLRERAALSAPRKSSSPHNAGLEGPLFHGGAYGVLNAEVELKTIRRDDRWGKKPRGFCERVECRGIAALSAPRKSFLPHNAGLEGPLFHGGAYGGLNAEVEFITIRRDDRGKGTTRIFPDPVEYRGRAALSAPRKSFLPHNAGLEGPLFHGGAGSGLNAEAEFKTIRRDDRWGKKPQGFFERVECRGIAALSAPRKSFLPHHAGLEGPLFHGDACGSLTA